MTFGMFHLGAALPGQKPVIDARTRDLMKEAQTPADSAAKYGLGWGISEERGIRRISHTGGMPGVTTVLNLYPDQRAVTLVLVNTSNARAVQRIMQAVNASVLPGLPPPSSSAPPSPPAGDPPAFRPKPEQVGEWAGTLRTWDRTLPLLMRVEADGDIKVRIGNGLWSLLNQVSWTEERLAGRFAGSIGTSDASRHPHTIVLDLRMRDGALAGQATAQTPNPPVYFALTSYAELRKRAATSSQF